MLSLRPLPPSLPPLRFYPTGYTYGKLVQQISGNVPAIGGLHPLRLYPPPSPLVTHSPLADLFTRRPAGRLFPLLPRSLYRCKKQKWMEVGGHTQNRVSTEAVLVRGHYRPRNDRNRQKWPTRTHNPYAARAARVHHLTRTAVELHIRRPSYYSMVRSSFWKAVLGAAVVVACGHHSRPVSAFSFGAVSLSSCVAVRSSPSPRAASWCSSWDGRTRSR